MMAIPKTHDEFYPIDMGTDGWASPPGYPKEIQQKILSGLLDEENKTGFRTRLLRFEPGCLYEAAPGPASAFTNLVQPAEKVENSTRNIPNPTINDTNRWLPS